MAPVTASKEARLRGSGLECTTRARTVGEAVSRTRVLIVDDDPWLLKSVALLLVRGGYEVRACHEFEDAMERVTDGWPDVLLTDLRLGSHNGLQLAILARELHPDMVTVVFTGYDDPVLHEEAARFGARYLTKPLWPGALLRTIASALAESGRSRSSATTPERC